ncbi:hypothetical protein J3459_015976 [Metarhizium acridum]|nr:hypothetical protein J3459_015976 [Metarhizium acridum]
MAGVNADTWEFDGSDSETSLLSNDDHGHRSNNLLPPLDRSQYTVGWLCALSVEYTAARQFLDQRHQAPDDLPRNNDNHYTLGQFGKHNIVIAILPMGQYGNSSAAAALKDMINAFYKIRVALMVGIAGGAPSKKHDIRLGDVVVSSPSHGHGGVLQYDFVKRIQNQEHARQGPLNLPPSSLRAVVAALQTEYKERGHEVDRTIKAILRVRPQLRYGFRKPDLTTDRLYKSEVTHPANNEGCCDEVCGTQLEKLVERKRRSSRQDNPAIHYGVVASGKSLIKDAMLRDNLALEDGVLCFEMEAARLMNWFSRLIIRGICDYADTHKNKEGRGYAAMVAAAYSKDLLYQLPPHSVENERKLKDVVESD